MGNGVGVYLGDVGNGVTTEAAMAFYGRLQWHAVRGCNGMRYQYSRPHPSMAGSAAEPDAAGKVLRRLTRSGTTNLLTPRTMHHGDLVEEVHGCPGRSGEVGLGVGCAPSSRGNIAKNLDNNAHNVFEDLLQ